MFEGLYPPTYVGKKKISASDECSEINCYFEVLFIQGKPGIGVAGNYVHWQSMKLEAIKWLHGNSNMHLSFHLQL